MISQSGGACCGRVVRFVHCTAVGSGEKRRPKFELGIPTRAVHEHNNNPGVCAGISKIACNAIAHLAARWCVHVRTPKYTQPNCNPLRSRVHYLPILRLHATSNMHLLRCSTVCGSGRCHEKPVGSWEIRSISVPCVRATQVTSVRCVLYDQRAKTGGDSGLITLT